jgi:hypothetical protein
MSKRKLTGRPSLFLSARLTSLTLGAMPVEPDTTRAFSSPVRWIGTGDHRDQSRGAVMLAASVVDRVTAWNGPRCRPTR